MAEIKKIAWNYAAENQLVTSGAAGADIDAIRRDVANNDAGLYQYDHGYIVVRIDGCELVLVAMAGNNAVEIAEQFMTWAKNNGLQSVRFHSNRRGAVKYAQKLGFKQLEVVYGRRV